MRRFFGFFILFLAIPASCWAGIEHLALMYGVLPADIALAGARTDGFPDAGAAYHNPAALADLSDTSLTIGYLYAQPQFLGGIAGRESEFDQANKVVALALGLDIGQVFPSDYPVAMGVNLLVDDNFNTIVAFDDLYHPNGQYIRYDTRSFTLAHSLGAKLFGNLNLGVGYLLTYNASVDLIQDVQITAATENEQIRLIGRPALVPMFAMQYKTDWVNIGLVYRMQVLAKVDPVTGTTSPKAGDTTIMDFPTEMKFIDGFEPHQVVLGLGFLPHERFSFILQGEYLNWKRFNDELREGNQSRRDVDIHASDLLAPRLGLLYRPSDAWEIRGGYAFEPSPFTRLGSGEKLLLDNDRHRLTVGAGYSYRPRFFKAPFSTDVALLYMPLVPREETTGDGQTLRSSGYMLGGAVALTFRY